MYRNLDECLRDVFRFGSLRIGPQGNTASVMRHCENKGVHFGSSSDLTQAEWHANAAMIQTRIARILNRYEYAVIACEYGGVDLHYIVDLTAWIEWQNKGVNLLICDALLEHLFTKKPKQTEIMDRYDISKGTFWRQKEKVSGCVSALLNSALCKLYDDFAGTDILWGKAA